MLSEQPTVEYNNLDYLKINRIKLNQSFKKNCSSQQIIKYDCSRFFYLASYSYDTFMSNDVMRELLFRINSGQFDTHKKNIDIVDFIKNKFYGDKTQQQIKKVNTKYFNFPQEIIFAHLISYGLRVSKQKTIDLVPLSAPSEDKNKVCFVKLYLFEKDFQEPLRNYLITNKKMDLQAVNSKLSGL